MGLLDKILEKFDADAKGAMDKLYPEGSREREILAYSEAHHIESEINPLLLGVFKVLMGVTVMIAVLAVIAFFSEHGTP